MPAESRSGHRVRCALSCAYVQLLPDQGRVRIRELRESAGLTRRQFAEAAKLNPAFAGRAERGLLAARPDVTFHVLTNGQHFDDADVGTLAHPDYRRVQWGVPLYSADAAVHDAVVAKNGAFERLDAGFGVLMRAGAEVELRTVLLRPNVEGLARLARRVASRLRFVSAWSIMQLENIGFARGRWRDLYFDHAADFAPVAAAVDVAVLHDVPVRLFNFARCGVPAAYRSYALASISDWKRRYPPPCGSCAERALCSGFFEWHPETTTTEVHPL